MLSASSVKRLYRNLHKKRIDDFVSYKNLGKLGFKLATYEILVSEPLTAKSAVRSMASVGPILLPRDPCRLAFVAPRQGGGRFGRQLLAPRSGPNQLLHLGFLRQSWNSSMSEQQEAVNRICLSPD